MSENTILKAIEIIKYAIDNGISVRKASVEYGFSETYVKNVKRKIVIKYPENKISRKHYDDFFNIYNNYLKKTSQEKKKNKGNNNTIKEDYRPTNLSNSVLPESIKYTVNDGENTINYQTNRKIKNNLNREDLDNYTSDHIKTLPQLLDACDVDEDIWKVKDYLVNKWDVTSWKRGYPETVENFQVKARLEKNKDVEYAKLAAEIFNEMTANYKPPLLGDWIDDINTRIVDDPISDEENNMYEISIFDLHLGKLGWAGEVGENFDSKIASRRFLHAIATLLKRASGYNINKILFPIGNDFFNSDNKENTTSHGTPQDEDLRWQKTFDVGCRLLVDGVNLLKQYGVPVKVILVPGNHDMERSYYVSKFLEAWFKDDEQIEINNSANPRKYIVHGDVLLGFTHGQDEKLDSLPLLMATEKESKKYWSDTVYHEWHLGHLHGKKATKYTILDKNKVIDENLGVTIRHLSSLTGAEEWHHRKGFVGNIKAAEGFIWNDKLGLIGQTNSNLIEK